MFKLSLFLLVSLMIWQSSFSLSRDPFQRKIINNKVVIKYPLNQMRFVGLIAMADRKWGLIQDLHGTVHKVIVGDKISQHPIVKIDPTALWVTTLLNEHFQLKMTYYQK